MFTRCSCKLILLSMLVTQASAHHSVLHYDGKREVVVSGTIVAGKFAFPHSVYMLDVESDQGAIERWTLRTEDPRDAQRLGFADTLEALRVGDRLTVIGWPHRFEEKEIRGHQLHFPDGRVVFLRRGNYIWPKDIKRIGRLVESPETLSKWVKDTDSSISPIDRLLAWVQENDPVARVAYEIANDRAKLIGIDRGDGAIFAGVEELLKCHASKPDFTMTISFEVFAGDQQREVDHVLAYIAEYNRLLSRWWEQERSSCS